MSMPAELNAIAGQVKGYTPPHQIIPPNANCKLTYEILQWSKTHPDGLTDDHPIGTVEISRCYKEDQKEYQIVEKRNGGGQEIYEATVVTTADPKIGESIQSWTLDWYQEPTSDKRMHLNGTVGDGKIEMDGVTGQKSIAINSPVSCQWILPFTLARRTIPLHESFTTLDELTYIKTDQQIQGPNQIEGNGEPLLSFSHTGQGTLPIHYIFDGHGRPVFVTFTLLSWVLRDISPF